MTTADYTKLLNKLVPKAGGEDTARIRTMVVSSVNSDGTVNLSTSGVIIPDIPRLGNAAVIVGEPVQVLTIRGSAIILGPVSDGASQSWTPQLESTGTSPNLGSTGEAVGTYTMVGGMCFAYARFLFSGSGISGGSGNFRGSLPFAVLQFNNGGLESSATIGAGDTVGNGVARDNSDVGTNSVKLGIQIASRTGGPGGVGQVLMYVMDKHDSTQLTSSAPWGTGWASGDRIAYNAVFPWRPV